MPIGRAKDITGKKFGYWTVLGRAPNSIGRTDSNWWCQCDCGNIKSVRKDQLESGSSKSCGCYKEEKLRKNGIEFGKKYGPINGKKNKKDLINQRFGALTVIKDSGKRAVVGNGTNVIWQCLCDCGKITYVTGGHLTSGHTQSCGCKKQSCGVEKIINLLKENSIVYEQEYSIKNFQMSTGGHPRFDFYIDKKYFIEYDGEQHFDCEYHGWNNQENFEKIQLRDKEKNNWCKENNIPLIRIPYTHLKNLCIEDLKLETSTFII